MEKKNNRMLSVDVLRGFDMFWLIGGAGLAISFFNLFPAGIRDVFVSQFEHVEWEGFHFYDLIFPLFEFVMGMSIVFSLSRIVTSSDKKVAYKRIFKRVVILYLLGIIYYGGLGNVWPEIRLVGVLPRLAFTYGIASVLFLNLNLRGLVITAVSILAGYWILLSFVPVPGIGVPSVSPDAHWPKYIDEHFLPGLMHDGAWDNCGILGTFPAVVNVLFGIFASLILTEKTITDKKKALYLIGGGLILVAGGYLWSFQLPIIKKIWTPSYVLVSGGYSFILMGLFYWIIDILHFKKWTLIFVWIGVNPITIYMLTNIFSFHGLARRFVGGNIEILAGEKFFPLLLNTAAITLALLLLRFMYNRKIFIKV